ncbi:hypothetical protein GTP38_24365 [Duganella sp. FT94W]|uniref:Uncharacterized protein n=1 Tax=Duganella lactea TaxID=2692173 RepID=A0ABW9VFR6_9BURK|nr:hypothetical protein [Duganella lactea]MYM37464.1 hypothetical protein [Duganella lactea]
MFLQPEFYLHIITGGAGDAAPLMARIALHLAHDSSAYPINLIDLKTLKNFCSPKESSGLNEFFVSEFLRSAMMEGVRNWTDHEIGRLKTFAHSPIPTIGEPFQKAHLNS